MFSQVVIVSCLAFLAECSSTEHFVKRQLMLDFEKKIETGGTITLNAKEEKANEVLMRYKNLTLEKALKDPTHYAPSMHFFEAKPLIEQDMVFKIIRGMPKGSVLHVHNTAAVSSNWVIKNLTYRPEAKLCEVDGKHYLTVTSKKSCKDKELHSIAALRAANTTEDDSFDLWLESLINLKLRNPHLMNADLHRIWKEFDQLFSAIKGFLLYKPFFEAFHTRMLEEFYEDNVNYIELRMSLSSLHDAEGNEYDPVQVATLLSGLVDTFKANNPNFFGLKIIFSKFRGIDPETAEKMLIAYKDINHKFPNLVIGFDLVGQEDVNNPLTKFVDKLRKFEKTPYFFHAGETNGYGSEADLNLADAIVLNARRIGHGYALYKHPILWRVVKRKRIALEVCPLSNQVLRLVSDLRNHPAVFYVSQSVPMVISCDDPGFWDSKGVSYDYYYAFMAMAPHSAGIGFLKQLVWDSVKYSSLTKDEYKAYIGLLKPRWIEFINKLASDGFAKT